MPLKQTVNEFVEKNLKSKLKNKVFEEDLFDVKNNKKMKNKTKFKDRDALYLEQQMKQKDELTK